MTRSSAPAILAFDTALPHCDATFMQGQTLRSICEDMKRGQAERLMPLLEQVLELAERKWTDLDMLAVGVGPGNFTGIRIAVSAARGLRLGLGIPVFGVSMFEVLKAENTHPQLVSLPAPREQVYVQYFSADNKAGQARLVPLNALPEDLRISNDTLVVGHEAEAIAMQLGCGFRQAETVDVSQKIARVAEMRWNAGERSPDRPKPLYVKPPDAAPSKIAAPAIVP